METSTRAHASVGRNAAIGIGVVALAAVALAVFLTVTSRRKPINTVVVEPTRATEAGIPPIDAEAPAQTETATFALG